MNVPHVGAAALTVAFLACATTPVASPDPMSDSGRTAAVLAATNRWTGRLNPTQSYTATVAATQRQKAYGTVELTVTPNRPTLTHVALSVTVPNEPGLNSLGWGIHAGNCGSGNPAVITPGLFPAMVVSVNGGASINDDIPWQLPESGNYHLNVFRGAGTQLSDVVTCADLRRQK